MFNLNLTNNNAFHPSITMTSIPVGATAFSKNLSEITRKDILVNAERGDQSAVVKFSDGERAIVNLLKNTAWGVGSSNIPIPVHAGGKWGAQQDTFDETIAGVNEGDFNITGTFPITATGATFTLKIRTKDKSDIDFTETLVGGPASLFNDSIASISSGDGATTVIVKIGTGAYDSVGKFATYSGCTVLAGEIPNNIATGDLWKIELVQAASQHPLGDHTDVNVTNVQDGDVLTYVSADSEWKNITSSTTPGGSWTAGPGDSNLTATATDVGEVNTTTAVIVNDVSYPAIFIHANANDTKDYTSFITSLTVGSVISFTPADAVGSVFYRRVVGNSLVVTDKYRIVLGNVNGNTPPLVTLTNANSYKIELVQLPTLIQEGSGVDMIGVLNASDTVENVKIDNVLNKMLVRVPGGVVKHAHLHNVSNVDNSSVPDYEDINVAGTFITGGLPTKWFRGIDASVTEWSPVGIGATDHIETRIGSNVTLSVFDNASVSSSLSGINLNPDDKSDQQQWFMLKISDAQIPSATPFTMFVTLSNWTDPDPSTGLARLISLFSDLTPGTRDIDEPSSMSVARINLPSANLISQIGGDSQAYTSSITNTMSVIFCIRRIDETTVNISTFTPTGGEVEQATLTASAAFTPQYMGFGLDRVPSTPYATPTGGGTINASTTYYSAKVTVSDVAIFEGVVVTDRLKVANTIFNKYQQLSLNLTYPLDTKIGDLANVDIGANTPPEGSVLTWDSGTTKWVASDPEAHIAVSSVKVLAIDYPNELYDSITPTPKAHYKHNDVPRNSFQDTLSWTESFSGVNGFTPITMITGSEPTAVFKTTHEFCNITSYVQARSGNVDGANVTELNVQTTSIVDATPNSSNRLTLNSDLYQDFDATFDLRGSQTPPTTGYTGEHTLILWGGFIYSRGGATSVGPKRIWGFRDSSDRNFLTFLNATTSDTFVNVFGLNVHEAGQTVQEDNPLTQRIWEYQTGGNFDQGTGFGKGRDFYGNSHMVVRIKSDDTVHLRLYYPLYKGYNEIESFSDFVPHSVPGISTEEVSKLVIGGNVTQFYQVQGGFQELLYYNDFLTDSQLDEHIIPWLATYTGVNTFPLAPLGSTTSDISKQIVINHNLKEDHVITYNKGSDGFVNKLAPRQRAMYYWTGNSSAEAQLAAGISAKLTGGGTTISTVVSSHLTHTSPNKLTWTNSAYTALAEISFSVSLFSTISDSPVSIYVNIIKQGGPEIIGNSVAKGSFGSLTDAPGITTLTKTFMAEIETDDAIELYVRNDSNSAATFTAVELSMTCKVFDEASGV